MLGRVVPQVALAEALAHALAIGCGAVLNYYAHALITFAAPGRSAGAA